MMKLAHEWVITSHSFLFMQLPIHALILVVVKLISVGKTAQRDNYNINMMLIRCCNIFLTSQWCYYCSADPLGYPWVLWLWNSSNAMSEAFHSNQCFSHYCDVIMGAMASQNTSLRIVYSTVHSGADQRKHQSSASLAFVRGIHRSPVNSPPTWPVTRKMFPFDDVIMGRPWASVNSMVFQCLHSVPTKPHPVYTDIPLDDGLFAAHMVASILSM